MHKMTMFPRWLYRLLWLCAAAAALSACQSSPPPAAAQVQANKRVQVLREQGFVQHDDGWELQMSGKLLFDFNSGSMPDERREILARIGRALADAGVQALRVEGHADDQGSAEYNQRLSLRRAQAVAQVLGEAGIPRAHIDVRGLGSSHPLVGGNSAAERRENRRAALIVPGQ